MNKVVRFCMLGAFVLLAALFLGGAAYAQDAALADPSAGGLLPVEEGTGSNAQIILWVSIALVVILFHVFIAVFIAIDGKKRKIGGYAGWAVFGAIPVLGIIGLFVYIIAAQPHQIPEDDIKKMLQQTIQQAEQRVKDQYEQLLRAKEAELDQLRGAAVRPDMGGYEEPATNIQKNEEGVKRLSLEFVTGDRAGHFEPLKLWNQTINRPQKVRLSRDAASQPASTVTLPWDRDVSNPHCLFSEDEDRRGYYVFDMDSTNGTFYRPRDTTEWKRVFGRQHIYDGDFLRVGNTVIKIHITEPVAKTLPGDEKGIASDVLSNS